MSRKDYTKYSNQPVLPVQSKIEEAEAIIEEPMVEAEQPVEEPVVEVEQPVEEVVEQKMGVVVNCTKLNVREFPDPDAEVVCTINASTNLLIDDEEFTDEYYKVCTEAGVEGYCMKKFIAVK